MIKEEESVALEGKMDALDPNKMRFRNFLDAYRQIKLM